MSKTFPKPRTIARASKCNFHRIICLDSELSVPFVSSFESGIDCNIRSQVCFVPNPQVQNMCALFQLLCTLQHYRSVQCQIQLTGRPQAALSTYLASICRHDFSLRTEAVLAGTSMAALPGSRFDTKSAEMTQETINSRPAVRTTLAFAFDARISPKCWRQALLYVGLRNEHRLTGTTYVASSRWARRCVRAFHRMWSVHRAVELPVSPVELADLLLTDCWHLPKVISSRSICVPTLVFR